MAKSATPWMDIAKGELGTKEAPGAADNPEVLSFYAEAGHPEIVDDEVAWCAAFAGAMLKRAGYPNTGSLAARSYLNYGRELKKPEPGCIVVFWRGSPTSWEGHVAFYVADAGTHIRVLGGNQGNAVTEAKFPKSQVLGYRMPVAATVPELRKAGSSEIATADTVQKVAVGTGAVVGTAEVVQQVLPPPSTIETLKDAVEQVTLTQKITEALHVISGLISGSRTTLVLVGCLGAVVAGYLWKRRRRQKAASGHPIGVADA